jgi:carbamoyl-phosphate synthase large subunit
VSVARLHEATGIDPWFLEHLSVLGDLRAWLSGLAPTSLTRREWRKVKRAGFSDAQLAYLWNCPEEDVLAARTSHDVRVTYKTVDTCGAEFAARTPYHYGTSEDEDEVAPLTRPAVVILGSGPNRIGQGVEFDYCCVHAAFALSDAGYETVMLNCNPETVSTDYDTSDRLFFEPLHSEDVLAVCRRLQEAKGVREVVVGLGSGRAVEARASWKPRASVLGTAPSIDRAEDASFPDALRAWVAGRRTASPAATSRRSGWRSRSAIPCWSGPRTCSAAAPWRSCTTGRASAATCARPCEHRPSIPS